MRTVVQVNIGRGLVNVGARSVGIVETRVGINVGSGVGCSTCAAAVIDAIMRAAITVSVAAELTRVGTGVAVGIRPQDKSKRRNE